jgi:hypothetical protein
MARIATARLVTYWIVKYSVPREHSGRMLWLPGNVKSAFQKIHPVWPKNDALLYLKISKYYIYRQKYAVSQQ